MSERIGRGRADGDRTLASGEIRLEPVTSGRSTEPLRHASADQAIVAIASTRHGVVTRVQLQCAGIPAGVLARRIQGRLLRRLHQGVYLVGPVLTFQARSVAAVLACGERSVVSHRSAAAIWEIMPVPTGSAPVEVILAIGDRRRTGVRIHRVRAIQPDECTTRDGIPVTTPARTLLDLAAGLARRELERAVVEAFGKRLTSRAALVELLGRHRRRPGTARLRALLGCGEVSPARSDAERRFLNLIRKARLPAPRINVMVGGFEVDFFWPAERLVVEVDGFAFHSTAGRFESDRRRDLALTAAGLRVIRVASQQLSNEPKRCSHGWLRRSPAPAGHDRRSAPIPRLPRTPGPGRPVDKLPLSS